MDSPEKRKPRRRVRDNFVRGVKLAWDASPAAFVGVTAYRTAFGIPGAKVGPQPDRLGKARVWVLPNPSGLNAHYQLPALVAEFGRLRQALSGDRGG